MRQTLTHRLRGFSLAMLIGAGLAAAVVPAAHAQDPNNGVPGDWLSRYMSARTAGFGGAFVAAANDPTGVVWNPAGLSIMSQNEIHFETARFFEETSLNGISFAMPASRLPSSDSES